MAEVVAVTQDTLDNEREMLKAFLKAEIQGWTDFVNDPEEGARLAVEEYGADLDLIMENAIQGALAQRDLVVSDETEQNGLFTISEELQQQSIDSLAGAGLELTADQLFDMSLLAEVYDENPELIDYTG